MIKFITKEEIEKIIWNVLKRINAKYGIEEITNWKELHFIISDVSPTPSDGVDGDVWFQF